LKFQKREEVDEGFMGMRKKRKMPTKKNPKNDQSNRIWVSDRFDEKGEVKVPPRRK